MDKTKMPITSDCNWHIITVVLGEAVVINNFTF
jgi:hypothetical protein